MTADSKGLYPIGTKQRRTWKGAGHLLRLRHVLSPNVNFLQLAQTILRYAGSSSTRVIRSRHSSRTAYSWPIHAHYARCLPFPNNMLTSIGCSNIAGARCVCEVRVFIAPRVNASLKDGQLMCTLRRTKLTLHDVGFGISEHTPTLGDDPLVLLSCDTGSILWLQCAHWGWDDGCTWEVEKAPHRTS